MMYEFHRLRESPYWIVEGSPTLCVVRLTRLPAPLPTVDAVDESFELVRSAIYDLPLCRWGLVFDMRQAKRAQDPDIENAFRENRKRIYRSFSRMSILLATAEGVMQVNRMLAKAPDPEIGVFNDEHEALAWASSGLLDGYSQVATSR